MMMRLIRALLVLGAVALTTASAASASKVLELSTSEGPLAAGQQLNIAAGSVFETPAGAIECPNGLLVATLLNNNASKDKVSISAGETTGKNGAVCNTSTALGSVEVEVDGLPWTQQFATSGKAQLKGHKKLGITVTVPLLGGLKCTYEARKIPETFPVTPVGTTAPLELSVSNQAFVKSSASNPLCPEGVTTNLQDVPVTIEGPAATLLPVYETELLTPLK
jgi:hypothetical protein